MQGKYKHKSIKTIFLVGMIVVSILATTTGIASALEENDLNTDINLIPSTPPENLIKFNSPSFQEIVDNGDGTFTFTQKVDEQSSPPHYLGSWNSGGTYGFGYYSWYNQDYGWKHTFSEYNQPNLLINSATLTIRAWDVDSETSRGYNGEYDGISGDGNWLNPQYLQGNNGQWSVTTFNVDPNLLLDGELDAMVNIDMHHNSRTWATTLDYSTLTVEYTYSNNNPPHLPEIAISSGSGCTSPSTDLVVTVTGPTPSDPDGDAVTYEYRWFVDVGTGGFVDDEFAGRGDHTGNTVPASDTQIGDIWRVQVTPIDQYGASGSYNTVTFSNIQNCAPEPPVVEAGPNQNVNEGGTVFLNGLITNPAPVTYTIDWDFGDGSTASETLTPSHVYADNGVYTVILTVTDNYGGAGTDTLAVTVNNVAPVVDAGSDATIDEAGTFISSGSFTDPGADTWIATVDYGDGSSQPLTLTGKTFALSHTYADNGAYTVTVTVKDDELAEGSDTATVTVNNIAPVVDAGLDATIVEAGTFTSAGSFTDPGADTWTATVDYGDGTGSQALALNPDKTFSLSHVYADDTGSPFTVTVTVTDDDSGTNSDAAAVTVTNVDPVVDAGSDATIVEAGAFTSSGSFTDPGADTWTATVDYGDGTGSQALALNPDKTFSLSHVYADDTGSPFTVTVTVTDDDSGTGSDTAAVTVTNVDPTVYSMTAPVDPVAVGTPITATASFTDPGTEDTHTAVWEWKLDSIDPLDTTVGAVDETLGSGSVSDTHAYPEAGIYTIKLTVTDDDDGAGFSVYRYVVVYDPNDGFVTGGGWINSPLGAYIDPACIASCLDPTGKANFGFVSKYKNGATTPTGQTQFQFKAGDLNFHSDSYQWLVIAGANAKYKGEGTINGVGNFGFMLTATDGDINGGGTVDTFRIKIWDMDNSDFVVYDNMREILDLDDYSGTELEGGSIKIHKK